MTASRPPFAHFSCCALDATHAQLRRPRTCHWRPRPVVRIQVQPLHNLSQLWRRHRRDRSPPLTPKGNLLQPPATLAHQHTQPRLFLPSRYLAISRYSSAYSITLILLSSVDSVPSISFPSHFCHPYLHTLSIYCTHVLSACSVYRCHRNAEVQAYINTSRRCHQLYLEAWGLGPCRVRAEIYIGNVRASSES
ncbi:hypothetical protein EDB19DRAFT_760357 [Suillus lakei]|nr:hypothetical protein EDB19DRAFT_760357 [Suillus lakei]